MSEKTQPQQQQREFTFAPGDAANPREWPEWRKWTIVLAIVLVDLTVSWLASGFSPAETKFAADFGVGSVAATLGLSMYVLGLALGPMLMAPLSEYFSRSSVYIIGYGLCVIFIMATAMVPTYGGFLVLRFFNAILASITIANFGGSIADMWEPHDTGKPMSVFLWAATCGSPSGYFLLSFVAATRPWRYVFWALLGICGGFWVIMTLTLKETRHTTILRRRAVEELKASGGKDADDPRYDILKHRSFRDLVVTALSRPFRFLFTEAIIVFGASFNGYLYGLSFLFNTAFSLVFGPQGHGFTTIEVGLAFLGIVLGISLGPVANLWQERYFQKHARTADGRRMNLPEARVQLGQLAVVVHTISLFWFAWTSFKSVHWIVPVIASVFWGWSFYTLILMTYMYTEDSYGMYSASALAGLGLVRNIAGAGFPLFGRAMYTNLGFEWASSVLAFLSILLIPIPFVLRRYGLILRKRSPWASAHQEHEEDDGEGIVNEATTAKV